MHEVFDVCLSVCMVTGTALFVILVFAWFLDYLKEVRK